MKCKRKILLPAAVLLPFSGLITGCKQNIPGEPAVKLPGLREDPRIYEMQGTGHTSSYTGRSVKDVPGLVTGVTLTKCKSNGVYLQDTEGSGARQTSDAVYGHCGKNIPPGIAAGDPVFVQIGL